MEALKNTFNIWLRSTQIITPSGACYNLQQSHQISCKSCFEYKLILANTQTGQKQYLPPGGPR